MSNDEKQEIILETLNAIKEVIAKEIPDSEKTIQLIEKSIANVKFNFFLANCPEC